MQSYFSFHSLIEENILGLFDFHIANSLFSIYCAHNFADFILGFHS